MVENTIVDPSFVVTHKDPNHWIKKGMAQINNSVLLCPLITREARLLYSILQAHNFGGALGISRPPQALLLEELGYSNNSKPTLRKLVEELVDFKLIEVKKDKYSYIYYYLLDPEESNKLMDYFKTSYSLWKEDPLCDKAQPPCASTHRPPVLSNATDKKNIITKNNNKNISATPPPQEPLNTKQNTLVNTPSKTNNKPSNGRMDISVLKINTALATNNFTGLGVQNIAYYYKHLYMARYGVTDVLGFNLLNMQKLIKTIMEKYSLAIGDICRALPSWFDRYHSLGYGNGDFKEFSPNCLKQEWLLDGLINNKARYTPSNKTTKVRDNISAEDVQQNKILREQINADCDDGSF